MLLGDPKQLAQPSLATPAPGAGASALEHILGEDLLCGSGLRIVEAPRRGNAKRHRKMLAK